MLGLVLLLGVMATTDALPSFSGGGFRNAGAPSGRQGDRDAGTRSDRRPVGGGGQARPKDI